LEYLLSKSVKVATLTSLIIVVGILALKQLSGSEHLTNVSSQESAPESEKKGFFSSLLNLSNDTLKQSNKLTAELSATKPEIPQILKSKPEVEVAKAVAKAQAVAAAQAEAHANSMQEINIVTQNAVQSQESTSDEDSVCNSRSPTEVIGYDENDSKYSDISLPKSNDMTC
jgi:ABC-type transporter Mla subunit MlaD